MSGYSLASRLFPDHIFTNDDPFFANRLGQPLGYPNALGVLVALGMLATLAFVSHGQRSSSVALAASMLPVQAATLYFTFSRGALAVLILSYIAAITLDPRWLRSLWASAFAALPSIACVAVAAQYDALATIERPFKESVHEGRELAVIVLLLAACSALFAWIGHVAARRVKISPSTKRWTGIGIVSAAVAGAIIVVVAVGGPAQGGSRLKEAFETPSPRKHRSEHPAFFVVRIRTGRALARRLGCIPRSSSARGWSRFVPVRMVRRQTEPQDRSRCSLLLSRDSRRARDRGLCPARVGASLTTVCWARSSTLTIRSVRHRSVRRVGGRLRVRLALGDGRSDGDRLAPGERRAPG